MDEARAREILGNSIEEDNGLSNLGWYLSWSPNYESRFEAILDGEFTADDLEAIAWWMRNKKEKQ